ncbi:MAG: DUF3786 domain-containing protein [Oscillospiraceae bacterium]|nr:DUF3786 domain-containing protein [Oscillospiraceae bacterium]
MEIKDNKTGVPLEHYRTLFVSKDPFEMSLRSGIEFRDGSFRLRLLDRPVEISHPDMSIRYADDGAELRPAAKILLLRLITGGSVSASTGKMLSYAEVPWGNVYLANFRGRCIMRLAYGFANDIKKFEAACESLGGRKTEGGDSAFLIEFIPGLTLELIVWSGEDDIPPSSQILFSDNFPAAFSAEDMAVVGDITIDAMKGIR